MHRGECYFWTKNPAMKVLLASFFLLYSLIADAQVKEGKVIYERTNRCGPWPTCQTE